MLEQYKRTFWRMQSMICFATLAVYFGLHRLWALSALFFLVMQMGSVIGASWAARLVRKSQGLSF